MGEKSKTGGLHYEVMNMNRKGAKDAKGFFEGKLVKSVALTSYALIFSK